MLAALRTAYGALPIVAATLAGWLRPFVGEDVTTAVARLYRAAVWEWEHAIRATKLQPLTGFVDH